MKYWGYLTLDFYKTGSKKSKCLPTSMPIESYFSECFIRICSPSSFLLQTIYIHLHFSLCKYKMKFICKDFSFTNQCYINGIIRRHFLFNGTILHSSCSFFSALYLHVNRLCTGHLKGCKLILGNTKGCMKAHKREQIEQSVRSIFKCWLLLSGHGEDMGQRT